LPNTNNLNVRNFMTMLSIIVPKNGNDFIF